MAVRQIQEVQVPQALGLPIRGISIQGYRSITRAVLHPGRATVIIGPSDSGKSNVVRAIRDWAKNAVGVSMNQVGRRVTRVALAVGPRYKVVWEKGCRSPMKKGDKPERVGVVVGKVRYVLVDAESGEPPQEFHKVGRTVPEELQELTHIRPLIVDEGTKQEMRLWLNIQEQDEQWFLLSSMWTKGLVSKVVGLVSGIHPLMLASRDLKLEMSRCLGEKRGKQRLIEQARVKLAEFDGVAEARAKLEAAKVLIAQGRAIRNRVKRAQVIVTTLEENEVARANLAAFLKKARQAVKAGQAVTDLERLSRAMGLATKLTDLRKRIKYQHQVTEGHKGALEGCANLLEEFGRGDLTCDLCGKPAHAACIKNLKAEASKARKT